MAQVIDQRKCIRCGVCVPVCPNDGVVRQGEEFVIIEGLCTECYGFSATPKCERVCPVEGAITFSDGLPEPEADLALRAAYVRPGAFPTD